MPTIEAVRWSPAGDAVRIIDQTLLPELFVERDLRSVEEVCSAIASLAVRGAPAIGIAGAIGLVTSLLPHAALDSLRFGSTLRMHAERIRRVRASPHALQRRRIGSGREIPIEQRGRDEIARSLGKTTVPEAARVLNPAFDITPAALVTGIISDLALHRPPYDFRALFPTSGAGT